MPAECPVSVPLTRTPWFDATKQEPAREGHYEVRYRLDGSGKFSRPFRRRWAAGTWQFTMYSQRFGVVDGDQWRGVAPESSIARGVADAAKTGDETRNGDTK